MLEMIIGAVIFMAGTFFGAALYKAGETNGKTNSQS